MEDIEYRYINFDNALFKQVINLRYDILFKPYGKIQKYTYDQFDSYSYHLVGIMDNNIVSYSRFTPLSRDNTVGKISNVVVNPDYNNMGIGIDMLKIHIKTSLEKKIKKIYLNARIDTIEFYKKAGFFTESSVFISDKSGLTLQKMFLKVE